MTKVLPAPDGSPRLTPGKVKGCGNPSKPGGAPATGCCRLAMPDGKGSGTAAADDDEDDDTATALGSPAREAN